MTTAITRIGGMVDELNHRLTQPFSAAAMTDGDATPAQADPPTDVNPAQAHVVSMLAATQLDSHAQTLRAIRAPTEVDPAAADPVSMLTAIQFSAYAEMFQNVAARFAAAHEAPLKGTVARAHPDTAGAPGDAPAADGGKP